MLADASYFIAGRGTILCNQPLRCKAAEAALAEEETPADTCYFIVETVFSEYICSTRRSLNFNFGLASEIQGAPYAELGLIPQGL